MKASKLTKLRRKAYRDSYVRSLVEQSLAFQIKEMRLARGLTQKQLADHLQLGSQSAVARLEDPSYGRLTLATIAKVAAFFDVAFTAKLISYSKFLVETDDVSPESMHVESFEREDEIGAIENTPEFSFHRRSLNRPTANVSANIGYGITMPLATDVRPTARLSLDVDWSLMRLVQALPIESSSHNITIANLTPLEHENAP